MIIEKWNLIYFSLVEINYKKLLLRIENINLNNKNYLLFLDGIDYNEFSSRIRI